MSRPRHPRFILSRVHPVAPVVRVEPDIHELPATPEEEEQALRFVGRHDWFIAVAGLRHERYNAVIGVWRDPLTCDYYAAYVSTRRPGEAAS